MTDTRPWEHEPRIPRGFPGGGRWTTGGWADRLLHGLLDSHPSSGHRIVGFHGRTDNRHPSQLDTVFVAPTREHADEFAANLSGGSHGQVYRVEYHAVNPLHIRSAHEFGQAWHQSGAGRVEGPFHAGPGQPSASRTFTEWVRSQGHDALVIHPEAFDTSDQKAWELIAGTYGDPQSVILDPSRAVFTPESATRAAVATVEPGTIDPAEARPRGLPLGLVDWQANQREGVRWAKRLVGRLGHGQYRPGAWQQVDPAEHMAERKDRVVTLFISDGLRPEDAHQMADVMFAGIEPPRAVYANGPHEVVIEADIPQSHHAVVGYIDSMMARVAPGGPIRFAIVPPTAPYFQGEGGVATSPQRLDGKAPWAVIHLNADAYTRPGRWDHVDWHGMPAVRKAVRGGNLWQYFLAHEYGHAMADGGTTRHLWLEHKDRLPPYGRGHPAEAVAEMFAEWFMSGGHSTNGLANLYAQWYRWDGGVQAVQAERRR